MGVQAPTICLEKVLRSTAAPFHPLGVVMLLKAAAAVTVPAGEPPLMIGALHGGGGSAAVQANPPHMDPVVGLGIETCRRRAHLKFTFHERLGEPVVDVKYATVKESLSSSGFTWQQHQGKGLQLDLKLLEECDWMKAMAWEQQHPLNCEEGPLWRLRMMPSEEDLPAANEDNQLFPTPSQVERALERTHTSTVDFPNSMEESKNASRGNSSTRKRFRTHIIGVFHHSAIDGISRKEFWDELLKAVIVLSNAKAYAEYASRVKALTAATAVASQPFPYYRQQKLSLEQQPTGSTPSSNSSVATHTSPTSPNYRWRRGSSNSNALTASAGTLCLRRSSAGNAGTLGEMDFSGGPYDSPSANTWCYIRRLSAVSAGSVDSPAYPADEALQSTHRQVDAPLPPPKTVLPPALNEVFPVTRCVSVLRPLMCPGHGLHIKLYLLEGELLKALRNPFACYYPSKRFRANGSEYQAYKAAKKALGPGGASSGQRVYCDSSEPSRQDQQKDHQPKEGMPFAESHLGKGEPSENPSFTGVVTLRLSEDLTAGLIAACKERKMTMNGLVTTAAAVALSRMLWRRNQVMQQHSVLADISRVAAASSAAPCWPLRHHSLWSTYATQEQREQLLKAYDGGTPQEGACVHTTEQGSLDTTLNSACASSEQDSAKATTSDRTQSPNSCETCSSLLSKGSYTSPPFPSDPLESPSVSPLVSEGMPRYSSLQEPLQVMRNDSIDEANEETKGRLQRAAACGKRSVTSLRCGWPLSHIPEMLQQLALRSPVSGEGTPGTPSRQFARHQGPVYIYTLQAISGRRWLDKWLQEQQQNPQRATIGRKMVPSDGKQFDDFLFQHLVVSMKSHKCSRTLAAMAAASVALGTSGSPCSPLLHMPPARHPSARLWGSRNGTSCSRSRSGSGTRRSTHQGLQWNPHGLGAERHRESCAFSNKPEQQKSASSLAMAGIATPVRAEGSLHRRKKCRNPGESEGSPGSFDSDLCFKTTEAFIETTGQSSLSTSSTLHCTFTSTLSAESLDDRADKSSVSSSKASTTSTSCSRRMHSHTRTVTSRISRGLRMITQWLWGTRKSSSRSVEPEKQQGLEELPPFGLGSYALLMPLKLRVPTECNQDADAIWALGKACTETVHRFVSLPNPSLATFDFQLISTFAEEIQGQLKCLHPVRNESFSRPSAFLISNGGVWAANSLNTFASKVHEEMRAAPGRHRKLLQHVLQHQMFLQQRVAKRPTLPPLPSQHTNGPAAADAVLKGKCQCGGRRPARNSRCSGRTNCQAAASTAHAVLALPNNSTRVVAADERLPADLMHSGDQQQNMHHQQPMGKEGTSGVECLLWGLEGLVDSLEPFELSVDCSWSIVSQHRTGLNYFAHNCVTVNGRMNWSLQYHSNLTSREIAALYASYILEVLQEAHDLHIQEKSLHQGQ
ncbi:hypothetical protein, conserved [Eimeria praecox]|uniref:Condensation domain-containing protein n=1 Tax=Eimeria praecox TaxID=51316 RepID=U6H9P0_9EIME|nr:hypothetical protein, conserved [Eimeria praecox]